MSMHPVTTLKKCKKLLYPHEVVKMPENLKARRAKYLVFSIIITTLMDILSMSIKGATFAIEHQWFTLGFVLLVLYYLRQSLRASAKVYLDSENQRLNAKSENYINGNIMDVANQTRGKVYSKTSSNSYEVMQNPEIILQMHNYIKKVWEFWITFPVTISNIIILFILSCSMIYMEWIDSKNVTVTLIFSTLLFVCVICYILVTKRRIQIANFYRKTFNTLRKKLESSKFTLIMIEPMNKKEFTFRANSFLNTLDEMNEIEHDRTKKFNELEIVRCIVIAIFMCIILCIKVYLNGSFSNITPAIIAEVIAIASIYEAILDKVVNILKHIEDIINNFKELEDLSTDFDNIVNTYDESNKFSTIDENVESVTVNPFVHEYPQKKSAYKLQVEKSFILEKGKSYLVSGPTGCGKSTIMNLICGRLLLVPSPISYGDEEQRGYLSSIMHQTNYQLGPEFILNEIILSKDNTDIDKVKLIRILKGLTIYDDIIKNFGIKEDSPEVEEMVINYLATTNVSEYSSGQVQRLTIVKLLYNLEPNHQIITFDEATNKLDNKTTAKVISFIKDFCMEDCPRIILFASHQIDVVAPLVEKSFTFDQDDLPISKIVELS